MRSVPISRRTFLVGQVALVYIDSTGVMED